MSYYLGLSILSTIYDTGAAYGFSASRRRGMERQRFRIEARRLLSLLEGKLLEEHEIAREAQGRPFFPDREVDFNIAHSGVLTAVSHVTGGNMRTGCDVERVRPRARAKEIAEDFFSAPEKNYVSPHGGFSEARFYEIWTLKECFLKLRGLSVFDMAACPSFINDKNEFAFGDGGALSAPVPSPLSFYLYELLGRERYMLATALEGTDQQPPEMRWFSHLSLVCKKIAEINAAPSPAETVRPKM